MCRSVKCRTCGRTTWAGCGMHVDQVRAGVPSGQWCNGQHSQQEQEQAQSGGFLARLFGR
jgi:hypothetical protein